MLVSHTINYTDIQLQYTSNIAPFLLHYNIVFKPQKYITLCYSKHYSKPEGDTQFIRNIIYSVGNVGCTSW